jgi:DNA invertase Pin-like site-specific DNA recombinase
VFTDLSGRRVDPEAVTRPMSPRRSPKRKKGRSAAELVREQRNRLALEMIAAGGKTRREVAEALGITRRALYDIERRAPERLRPPRTWLRPDNRVRAEGRAAAG